MIIIIITALSDCKKIYVLKDGQIVALLFKIFNPKRLKKIEKSCRGQNVIKKKQKM